MNMTESSTRKSRGEKQEPYRANKGSLDIIKRREKIQVKQSKLHLHIFARWNNKNQINDILVNKNFERVYLV